MNQGYQISGANQLKSSMDSSRGLHVETRESEVSSALNKLSNAISRLEQVGGRMEDSFSRVLRPSGANKTASEPMPPPSSVLANGLNELYLTVERHIEHLADMIERNTL